MIFRVQLKQLFAFKLYEFVIRTFFTIWVIKRLTSRLNCWVINQVSHQPRLRAMRGHLAKSSLSKKFLKWWPDLRTVKNRCLDIFLGCKIVVRITGLLSHSWGQFFRANICMFRLLEKLLIFCLVDNLLQARLEHWRANFCLFFLNGLGLPTCPLFGQSDHCHSLWDRLTSLLGTRTRWWIAAGLCDSDWFSRNVGVANGNGGIFGWWLLHCLFQRCLNY